MAQVILTCRDAREPLAPGSLPSPRNCRLCDEPLQMSGEGRLKLASHPDAWVVCNDCGLALVQELEGRGRIEVQLHENAKREMAAGHVDRNPLTQWVRDRK